MKLSNEAKVGILVTASLAALLWGLNYLKGKDLFTSRNKYFAVYDNVDNLVTSNPVFLSGYRIGIINDIDFMPDKSGRLLVTMLIQKDVFIPKNSIAKIFNADLIGTKAMRIDLGTDSESLKDEDTLHSELESSLAQQLGKEVGPIKDKTERLIVSIDSVVNMLYTLFDPSTKNNLRSGISHLNGTLSTLDHSLGNDQGKLNIMISNLSSITTNLKNNNEQINKIIDNLAQVSDTLAKAHFASTIANADQVLFQSAELLKKINSGQGSMGMLINDPILYNNANTTAKDLDELLKDLKANPKRYVHFSVFGKKDKVQ
ncbi:MlaD family protein [soil metagenome]